MVKPVPCMEALPSHLPDERNWVFVDAVGAPVNDTKAAPHRAYLPVTEVAAIFELVAYLNKQFAACHAATPTP